MKPMTEQEKKTLKVGAVLVPVLAVIFYFTGQYLSNQVKAHNAEKYMSQSAAVEEVQPKEKSVPAGMYFTEPNNQTVRAVPVEEVPVDEETKDYIRQAAEGTASTQNEVTVKTDDKGNEVVTPDWNKEPPKTEVKTPSTTTSASSGTSSETATKKPSSSTTTKKSSDSSSSTTTTKPKTEPTKPSTKPSSSNDKSSSSSGSTSKGGDKSLWGKTNDKGETYVPGFGWTKPTGSECTGVATNAGTGEVVGH